MRKYKLYGRQGIATATDALPELTEVWRRNFPRG
jgi:hypothetical protein